MFLQLSYRYFSTRGYYWPRFHFYSKLRTFKPSKLWGKKYRLSFQKVIIRYKEKGNWRRISWYYCSYCGKRSTIKFGLYRGRGSDSNIRNSMFRYTARPELLLGTALALSNGRLNMWVLKLCISMYLISIRLKSWIIIIYSTTTPNDYAKNVSLGIFRNICSFLG